MALIDTVDV